MFSISKQPLLFLTFCLFFLACNQMPLEGTSVSGKFVVTDHLDEGAHLSSLMDMSQSNPEYFQSIAHPWQIVGPAVQPQELNPGGRAIPAYATGRGNGTGRVNFIYINPALPSQVFACSPSGGLFVSNDVGAHWRNAGTDQLPISGVAAICVNPNDARQWYIATGDGDDRFMFSDGIWRTDDAGEHWMNINGRGRKAFPVSEDRAEYTYVTAIMAHPDDFSKVFVASNKGLYMTTQGLHKKGKAKWQLVASSFFYDLELWQRNPDVVFASGEKFMMSRDAGKHWEYLSLPHWEEKEKHDFLRINMEQTAANPGVLYCGITSADGFTGRQFGKASLQKYHIESGQWEFVRSLKQGMDNMIHTRARAMAVSPTDSALILVGNVQPVYRSTDGGKSFVSIAPGQAHDDIHDLTFSPDGQSVFMSHDGGVSISFDGGLHWQARDTGIGVANVFGLSVAQSTDEQVLYGAYDTGGNLLRNGKWYHVSWGDGFETIIHPEDPDIMFATSQNGVIYRSLVGDDFDFSAGSSKSRSEWHSWIGMHPRDHNVIFCAGSKLLRSSNLGEDWEVLFDPKLKSDSALTVFRFWMSESHPETMYLYVLNKNKIHPTFYVTHNLSAEDPQDVQWKALKKPPIESWFANLVVDPENPERFWLVSKTFHPTKKVLFFNGYNYIDFTANLGYCIAGGLAIDATQNRLYIGSNYGVFTRRKGEKSWTLLEGLPGTFIDALEINHVTRQLYVGTFGRGIWKGPLLSK